MTPVTPWTTKPTVVATLRAPVVVPAEVVRSAFLKVPAVNTRDAWPSAKSPPVTPYLNRVMPSRFTAAASSWSSVGLPPSSEALMTSTRTHGLAVPASGVQSARSAAGSLR